MADIEHDAERHAATDCRMRPTMAVYCGQMFLYIMSHADP